MYSYWKRQQIKKSQKLWKNFFIGVVIGIAILIAIIIGGKIFPY